MTSKTVRRPDLPWTAEPGSRRDTADPADACRIVESESEPKEVEYDPSSIQRVPKGRMQRRNGLPA